MKTINEIPKDIIEMYDIRDHVDFIFIHKPNPIAFSNYSDIVITNKAVYTEIKCSGRFIITLWKATQLTQITLI